MNREYVLYSFYKYKKDKNYYEKKFEIKSKEIRRKRIEQY